MDVDKREKKRAGMKCFEKEINETEIENVCERKEKKWRES